ncbi:MAG: ATP-dependent DNA helicase [Solirubrobacteraceae bacterium]|jgi:DNA helicase-2/ATP-dependent DNA helicase PcrA
MSATPSPAHGLPLDEHIQLIACAGAGKTEAVSQRVIEQLQLPGVKPVHVVAFAFNERAAAELKERIALRWEERTGTRDGLADLYVGTIHGFCLELLQQNHYEVLPYRVLNDIQQRHLITRNSRKCGLADLGWHRYMNAGTYAELMSILREADVDEQVLAGTVVEACLDKYLTLLAEKRYLDFSAIVADTVMMLEDDAGFRARVADRVQYLTVDEYQDVNPIQERLVHAIANLGAVLTVVGDDDQLLYGWRGSSVENILHFPRRYPDVQTARLERNFRSSRGIVGLARRVIEHNDPDRLVKAMSSAGSQTYEEGDIDLREFDGPDGEAEYIAERILDLRGMEFVDRPGEPSRGLSFADIAVMVRVKKLIPAIVDALERHEIPFVVGGVANLFDTAEAVAARELFYFLAGEAGSDEAALRAAWKDARLGATAEDLARALAVAVRDRADIASGEERFGIYNLQRSFLGFLTALVLREEKIQGASTSHAHSRSEVVYYNLGKFSEVISDFEQINFQSDPLQKYAGFAGFLRHQAPDVYPEGWLEARYVTPDAVQILTIHQAKGLQWPVVFVPGLTKERFPPRGGGGRSPWHVIPEGAIRNAADYVNSEEDERRLFYVACTRAKKYLTITRADYPTAKRVWRTPSPFWLEATDALASVSPPDPAPKRPRLEPTPARALADVTLSFSELKYAFECPYSFKLRFLYGFNPPIAEALGFGKGLHDALFEIHDRVLHGEEIDQHCVPALVDRHVFLPFAYPDLRETLSAAATRRLDAYLAARGATFDDIEHAERPIEVDLGDGIRVNGRIDLIRRRSTNEIVVIDFKSNDRTQQEEVTDLQLRVYALGYEQATGERASEVVVDNLDDLAHPRSSAVDEAMLSEAVDAVREVGARLRGNAYPRTPRGTDARERDHVCEHCDLVGVCGGHGRPA